MATYNVYRDVDSRNGIDRQLNIVSEPVLGDVWIVIDTENAHETINFSEEQFSTFVEELVKIKNQIKAG